MQGLLIILTTAWAHIQNRWINFQKTADLCAWPRNLFSHKNTEHLWKTLHCTFQSILEDHMKVILVNNNLLVEEVSGYPAAAGFFQRSCELGNCGSRENERVTLSRHARIVFALSMAHVIKTCPTKSLCLLFLLPLWNLMESQPVQCTCHHATWDRLIPVFHDTQVSLRLLQKGGNSMAWIIILSIYTFP